MRTVLVAVQFLTRFPVRLADAPTDDELARAAGWFPLVGAAVGGAAALGWALGAWAFVPRLSPWLGPAGAVRARHGRTGTPARPARAKERAPPRARDRRRGALAPASAAGRRVRRRCRPAGRARRSALRSRPRRYHRRRARRRDQARGGGLL